MNTAKVIVVTGAVLIVAGLFTIFLKYFLSIFGLDGRPSVHGARSGGGPRIQRGGQPRL